MWKEEIDPRFIAPIQTSGRRIATCRTPLIEMSSNSGKNVTTGTYHAPNFTKFIVLSGNGTLPIWESDYTADNQILAIPGVATPSGSDPSSGEYVTQYNPDPENCFTISAVHPTNYWGMLASTTRRYAVFSRFTVGTSFATSGHYFPMTFYGSLTSITPSLFKHNRSKQIKEVFTKLVELGIPVPETKQEEEEQEVVVSDPYYFAFGQVAPAGTVIKYSFHDFGEGTLVGSFTLTGTENGQFSAGTGGTGNFSGDLRIDVLHVSTPSDICFFPISGNVKSLDSTLGEYGNSDWPGNATGNYDPLVSVKLESKEMRINRLTQVFSNYNEVNTLNGNCLTAHIYSSDAPIENWNSFLFKQQDVTNKSIIRGFSSTYAGATFGAYNFKDTWYANPFMDPDMVPCISIVSTDYQVNVMQFVVKYRVWVNFTTANPLIPSFAVIDQSQEWMKFISAFMMMYQFSDNFNHTVVLKAIVTAAKWLAGGSSEAKALRMAALSVGKAGVVAAMSLI